MRFSKLQEMLPYVSGGKQKILSCQPYNAITLRFPGRHAKDTVPEGGDFVVCVDDDNLDWTAHQFTHNDLFNDLELKVRADPLATEFLMNAYLKVVQGADPAKMNWDSNLVPMNPLDGVGLHPQTFLYAVQCLAIAEHRRYAKFEVNYGGRFLPFRFSAGIVEGLWDAQACVGMQRRGRPGVEILEKVNGTPVLTKELMG